ncbi:VanZ family protein [Streptococcus marmotae]|uniref:VanZ family protein n=1 Tax=Streptococcus marmotae TaxID=1825069 RepID=UPI00082956C5|nr:VanZ family protein [Streptococcus marmotae]
MNKKYLLLDSMNALLSFFVCRYVFMHYLYFQYYLRMVVRMPEIDFVGPLLVILVMSYSVFVFMSFFYRKHVDRKMILVLYAIYFACLAFLLVFKSMGIKGLVLNPMETLQDIQAGNIFVPLMNLVMFIPLGTLVTRKKQFLVAVAGVIGVEIAQYVFSFGICDTGDIVLNSVGILIGIAIRQIGLLKFFLEKIG